MRAIVTVEMVSRYGASSYIMINCVFHLWYFMVLVYVISGGGKRCVQGFGGKT
jgi:hypothetical protein